MKENQICLCATGECERCELPPCVARPTKLSPQPDIAEDWSKLLMRESDRIDRYFKASKCPIMSFRHHKWTENYERLWIEANPIPKLTLREAYNQSLARISKLEAALAKKGGAR